MDCIGTEYPNLDVNNVNRKQGPCIYQNNDKVLTEDQVICQLDGNDSVETCGNDDSLYGDESDTSNTVYDTENYYLLP